MNYYPFHIGDYLSATRHLSWEEDAAFRRLLDTYYTTEKALPVELRQVYRLVLATTETQRQAVEQVLNEFFELAESGWVNHRADAEIAEMQERQSAAKAKANKRWDKHRAGLSNASAMPQHTKTDATASEIDANAMLPTPTPTPIYKSTPASSATQPTKKATRITSGWSPNPELEKWSKSERPDLNIESTTESFVDYWIAKPGKDGLKLDWDATFRNWVKAQRQSFNPGKQASNVFAGAI